MSPGVEDTTYTKVFVGGLAWETQQDTMKKYFEQFGEILEAVVITHKTTGRSKGYGFVTFAEPEAAMSACADPSPVIDGRRANCNLAAFGPQRSKISTPKPGGGRLIGSAGGFGTALASAATFPHYAIQQGIPYTNVFGYPPYSAEYPYPMNYYGAYAGSTTQYPIMGAGGGTGMLSAAAAAYYPYQNIREVNGGATGYSTGQGYGVQYPHHLFQCSTGFYPQTYRTPVSLPPATPMPSGMTMALHAPMPIPHH